MQGIIGKKLGMTQVFIDDGAAVPVTVIEVRPSVIVQKKTIETDGYGALQLGNFPAKEKNASKARIGHCKKAGKGPFKVLREIPGDSIEGEIGQELGPGLFKPGDYVDVIGTTKGKGFAGVIKRHGFRGGRATHGSMFHRAPGSIGASAEPSRVFKGTRMAGQLGGARKTVQNLRVLSVRPEFNVMLVKGAVPGSRGGTLLIMTAKKRGGLKG